MSTIMHVVFNLSMFRNLLTTLCVVLLVSFSVSSLRLPDNRNVRSPDDRIVFPGEQAFNSEEQFGEDGKYYESKSFRHNPEFHGMHSFLPSPSDKTGPNLPHFHRRLKFHDDTVEYNNKTLNVVPLDLIQNINEVDNVSEILLNFVEGEDRIDADSSILADRFEPGERNAAVTPKSAGCMPELQVVKLATSDDASILHIPQCTRIERCGGCCSHHLLSCQPTDSQPVSFSVMKTQYVGGKKLKFVGKEIVVLEKHTKCKCDCKVKAEDCNRFQQYKKSECRCSCINTDEEKKCYSKNQTKLWDPELCSCICREVKQCSTGTEFDPIECRCTSKPNRNRYSEAQPLYDYEK